MPRKARYDREKIDRNLARVKDEPSRAVRNKRTPEAAERRTVKELARVYTEDALNHLAKIMRKSKYPGLQLAAIEQILNRGWGKPANALAGPDGDGPIEIDIKEIRRTIVDPVEFDDDDDDVRSIEGQARADMETIKARVRRITTPKKVK